MDVTLLGDGQAKAAAKAAAEAAKKVGFDVRSL